MTARVRDGHGAMRSRSILHSIRSLADGDSRLASGRSGRARARRIVRYGLLAALLLLGRSALIAHDAIHWQPKLDGPVCQLCLHHVGQSEIAGGTSSFALDHVPPPQLVAERIVAVFLTPHRRCRIRGPPLFFD